ncbi:MAG: DUF421 domain-containing protein [Cyanobacteriota bacterium]|nr:DUF421 domain-containing protein [Cyanobacteriota bacterium]
MEKLFHIDWETIFIPSTSVAELFIRGSLVYLALFSVLRILPNRQIGTVGINDVLVVVLFAEAAQNAMASDYTSISEGVILVGTIIFWSYFLNWLGYKIPDVGSLVSPPPLILVEDGRLINENMEQELLTEEELMSQLRQQGVESLEKVKRAYMEADGRISVITTGNG